jgi:FtsH-binding integral membrane protein
LDTIWIISVAFVIITSLKIVYDSLKFKNIWIETLKKQKKSVSHSEIFASIIKKKSTK